MAIYLKDPSSSVDYSIDWAAWLEEPETIASTTWSINPSGILAPTLGTEGASDTTRSIFVSGGTVGQRYRLTCRIQTDAGRTVDRSLTIRIAER